MRDGDDEVALHVLYQLRPAGLGSAATGISRDCRSVAAARA